MESLLSDVLPPGEATQIEEESSEFTEGACTAQLTLLAGPQIGRVVPLTRTALTLGRAQEVDVRISHTSVSKRHARISRVADGGYELEDLGSSNGTRINGQVLRGRRRLRSGDRIQLGPRVLLQFSLIDQLDRRMQEIEGLEAVGRLSAAVHNDLATLLSVFNCGLTQLSGLDPNICLGAPDVLECLDDMRLAATRASELTQRLGTLVRRPDVAVHERVDLSALCDEVVRMMRRLVPDSVRIEADVEPGLWIDGNRAWIHQLLMNPCTNARDAMPNGGVLRFEARLARENELPSQPSRMAAPQLLISISDTGVGIPADIMPRVFQPFFTTKREGTASGLGLATVARVASEHGGSVRLSSQPGIGTCLRLLLPQSTYRQGDSALELVNERVVETRFADAV